MSTRIQNLIQQYDLEGDTEAADGLRRALRRHQLMRAGRAAQWAALPIALAIAVADLVRFRVLADGLHWQVRHISNAPHHWLWLPLGLVGLAAAAYWRAQKDD